MPRGLWREGWPLIVRLWRTLPGVCFKGRRFCLNGRAEPFRRNVARGPSTPFRVSLILSASRMPSSAWTLLFVHLACLVSPGPRALFGGPSSEESKVAPGGLMKSGRGIDGIATLDYFHRLHTHRSTLLVPDTTCTSRTSHIMYPHIRRHGSRTLTLVLSNHRPTHVAKSP